MPMTAPPSDTEDALKARAEALETELAAVRRVLSAETSREQAAHEATKRKVVELESETMMKALILLLLLSGCSGVGEKLNTSLQEFDAHLHPKCGWVSNVNPIIVDRCTIWRGTDGCLNLPAGASPCDWDVFPSELRVEAGAAHSEWFRYPLSCEFRWDYCE